MPASQLRILDRLRKRLNMNRLDRMMQHYAAVREQLDLKNAKDARETAFFSTEFERYAKLTRRLINIRLVLWIFLYAALFVNVLKLIPFLAFLVAFVEFGSALFGTTLLFIAVFILSMRIRLNLELMQDCMTHLIVIYYKNPKRDTSTMLGKVARVI